LKGFGNAGTKLKRPLSAGTFYILKSLAKDKRGTNGRRGQRPKPPYKFTNLKLGFFDLLSTKRPTN
jgi:hypothetical protein